MKNRNVSIHRFVLPFHGVSKKPNCLAIEDSTGACLVHGVIGTGDIGI